MWIAWGLVGWRAIAALIVKAGAARPAADDVGTARSVFLLGTLLLSAGVG